MHLETGSESNSMLPKGKTMGLLGKFRILNVLKTMVYL